jgi:hypothetical protein
MSATEREILVELDQILRSEKVRTLVRPVAERVRAKLSRETEALMTWEPIPLTIYGSALPDVIKSSWVFVLRAGVDTGAERHPNSHQRMNSFQGTGDMRVQDQDPPNDEARMRNDEIRPENAEPSGNWKSNLLISDWDAPLEKRWISIPQNVWHQPVISKEADWVVVSFHTVPAEELIEERPESAGTERTKQMRYLG